MKVLVMTKADFETASTKYRIVQYADVLEAKGFKLDFVKRSEINRSLIDRARAYDVVFNQRCLIRTSLAKKIIANSRRVIFDFDDAIYTRSGEPRPWLSQLTSVRKRRRLRLWLESASVVTTANHFLASYARQYSSAVEVIPNAIDLEVWKPLAKEARETVTLGWAGSRPNVRNLERLGPLLALLVKKYPSLKLAIFSGTRPRLACPFEHHPFEPGKEVEFVQSLDIGLLPLVDEEYSKGKSPIKAIQYLACGVPVVGNPIGATAEILNDRNSIAASSDEEWISALEILINDRQRIASLGKAGREFAEKHHDIRITAEQRMKVFLGKELGDVP